MSHTLDAPKDGEEIRVSKTSGGENMNAPESKQKTVTIPIRIFEVLMLESFRYCLGRRTYATGVCVENLTKYWDLIPDCYKKQMHEDINRAIKLNIAGDRCDIAEWRKILELKI